MSSDNAAIARLGKAITRLEEAATRLADAGHGETIASLEAENRRLKEALAEATDGQEALEGRVRDVSGRLDGMIGELKTVLGR